MTLSTKYNPREVEDKWYAYWMEKGYFHSEPNPDKEPYTIVIPPPNVTGILHMGHMLNNTIQDVLVRKARMEGKEACWVPGMDHASIATEAKVVALLKEQGLDKRDIGREEFLKHAWEWKEKYGGIILEQLKKLGASCDWERTRFTMEEKLSQSVIEVFVDLYNKGKIYRGIRMVNWDPEGMTAVSDDEVIHKEVASKLYYVNYEIEGEEGSVTIATTRPETILGDTAVCVNPNDDRYKHLKGKSVKVPLIGRIIPVIEDDYVSMEFGTGCLKITPAHDLNDYEIGNRHNLESIEVIADNGTLNEAAQILVGEDRFVARKKIAKMLKESGNLQKIEDYTNNVGFSERTDAVIEPKLSMQWFLQMDEITAPALENVMNDNIRFHPAKFKNMYRSWMENVRDWCISRQLWWGHQIPAYYLPDGQIVVAETSEEALELAREKSGNPGMTMEEMRQDEDVLDTWFSSCLWPISVFDGLNEPGNKDIKYYYPTNDLVTAPEILFFWVARMVIWGYEYMGEKPFRNVYLTGIVRDKQGRKMSKSLGNSPDPLELIDLYGADGVRTGMLFSSPAGNDLLFDIKLCEQGRNFSNKIWNAFRLIKGLEIVDGKNPDNEMAIQWFESKYYEVLQQLEDNFDKFRISDALMNLYKLIWNDFCAWYLEMIKPEYGKPIDQYTYDCSIGFFEDLMKILHPFMPFISEEIWHEIRERKENDCIIIAKWPEQKSFNSDLIETMEEVFEVISNIRNIRSTKQLSPKQALSLYIKTVNPQKMDPFQPVLRKLANLEAIHYQDEKVENANGFIIKGDEYSIPMEGLVDSDQQKEKLEKELQYTKGFLAGVDKKLSNERFVNNAPAKVIEMEKNKKKDAEAKIKALQESLASL